MAKHSSYSEILTTLGLSYVIRALHWGPSLPFSCNCSVHSKLHSRGHQIQIAVTHTLIGFYYQSPTVCSLHGFSKLKHKYDDAYHFSSNFCIYTSAYIFLLQPQTRLFLWLWFFTLLGQWFSKFLKIITITFEISWCLIWSTTILKKKKSKNFRNLFLLEFVMDIVSVFYLLLCNSQSYTGGSTTLKNVYNTSSLWFSISCTQL